MTQQAVPLNPAAAVAPWASRQWATPLADPSYRASVWRRIVDNVEITDSGCWEWQGFRNSEGYGAVSVKRRMKTVHQVAVAIDRGAMWPVGLHIDHLCRNPPCCNPAHLEIVTPRENTIRGISPIATRIRAASQTHCKAGHLFDEANTYIKYRSTGPTRMCRACRAATSRKPATCLICGVTVGRGNLRRHERVNHAH